MKPFRILAAFGLVAALSSTPRVAVAELDLVTVYGPARATSSANDHEAAWRDVGIRLDGRDFAFEARTPTCQALTQSASTGGAGSTVSCSTLGDGLSSFAPSSRRASLVWKPIHEDERLPGVDLVLRHWRSRIAAPGSGVHGTTATVVVSKTFASIETVLAYELPAPAAPPDARWRTMSASVAWPTRQGPAIELSGDFARNTATGERDRSWTLRLSHRFRPEGPRLVAWVRRSLDGSDGPVRVGMSTQFRY